MADKKRSHRGGKRPGAGRKKTTPADAKVRYFRLTDTEFTAVKELINTLRNDLQTSST